MIVKDLMQDLEKGDRTKEMLKPKALDAFGTQSLDPQATSSLMNAMRQRIWASSNEEAFAMQRNALGAAQTLGRSNGW